MTGEKPLLQLRRAGHKPRAVWVVDGEGFSARSWHEHPQSCTREWQPEIEIAEDDIPEALDLRVVIGMVVLAQCFRSPGRARRLHQALIAAGAKTVVTTIYTREGVEMLTHGVANG